MGLQDNTIADRPVVELVTSLTHMLEKARHRMAGGSLAQPPLNQLVLIISDGRFHEKESLRRIVAVRVLMQAVLHEFAMTQWFPFKSLKAGQNIQIM